MNEGPIVISIHVATFAGIATILGLLLREHKVWIRMKDRVNQLWRDRCHAKNDDYVPLENGNH